MSIQNLPGKSEQRANQLRRAELERAFICVITVLNSDSESRTSSRFGNALQFVDLSLSRVASYHFRYVPSRIVREELARDAVQTWYRNMLSSGFVAYLRHSDGRPFVPYAVRALRNICLSMSCQEKGGLRGEAVEELCDTAADPVRTAERREVTGHLREAILLLPLQLQECLRLTYWEDLSAKDVADELGGNPKTVATWNFRSRRWLRARLKEYESL